MLVDYVRSAWEYIWKGSNEESAMLYVTVNYGNSGFKSQGKAAKVNKSDLDLKSPAAFG